MAPVQPTSQEVRLVGETPTAYYLFLARPLARDFYVPLRGLPGMKWDKTEYSWEVPRSDAATRLLMEFGLLLADGSGAYAVCRKLDLPYLPELIERVKALGYARWLPDEKVWEVPATASVYEELWEQRLTKYLVGEADTASTQPESTALPPPAARSPELSPAFAECLLRCEEELRLRRYRWRTV